MMFNPSSRMKLLRSLLLAAFAIAGSAALPTPAAAAKQSDVLAACKRTPGCWSDTNNNSTIGCSPHACFLCQKGKCVQTRTTGPGGQKNISTVGTAVGTASTASGTKMSVNRNVESITPNKLPVNGPVSNNRPPIGNPGSMNGRMSGKH
jgi:hypothetical protein